MAHFHSAEKGGRLAGAVVQGTGGVLCQGCRWPTFRPNPTLDRNVSLGAASQTDGLGRATDKARGLVVAHGSGRPRNALWLVRSGIESQAGRRRWCGTSFRAQYYRTSFPRATRIGPGHAAPRDDRNREAKGDFPVVFSEGGEGRPGNGGLAAAATCTRRDGWVEMEIRGQS